MTSPIYKYVFYTNTVIAACVVAFYLECKIGNFKNHLTNANAFAFILTIFIASFIRYLQYFATRFFPYVVSLLLPVSLVIFSAYSLFSLESSIKYTDTRCIASYFGFFIGAMGLFYCVKCLQHTQIFKEIMSTVRPKFLLLTTMFAFDVAWAALISCFAIVAIIYLSNTALTPLLIGIQFSIGREEGIKIIATIYVLLCVLWVATLINNVFTQAQKSLLTGVSFILDHNSLYRIFPKSFGEDVITKIRDSKKYSPSLFCVLNRLNSLQIESKFLYFMLASSIYAIYFSKFTPFIAVPALFTSDPCSVVSSLLVESLKREARGEPMKQTDNFKPISLETSPA